MTNADRIRAMTDEELTVLVDNSISFFSCDECAKPGKQSDSMCASDCKYWIGEYLKAETIEDEI